VRSPPSGWNDSTLYPAFFIAPAMNPFLQRSAIRSIADEKTERLQATHSHDLRIRIETELWFTASHVEKISHDTRVLNLSAGQLHKADVGINFLYSPDLNYFEEFACDLF
jgi:hypothetical protein